MGQVFGPVPSRRLGRSLGVDLVPFKTCSYDCIYCQLGRTTCLTAERREWVDLDAVIEDLGPKLALRPDYVTLSGSGEPTLYARMGELIERMRAMTDVPIAVLTNGSLLWRDDVRRELRDAHLVIPSLDAGDEATFRAVNRPVAEISFEAMLEGLVRMREESRGDYWLEVFFLDGYNASDADARRIADCVARIRPDRVQLNTATRPTAEDFARKVSPSVLAALASRFAPPGEVIADYRGVHREADFQAGHQGVLELLRRRPCSLDDIAEGLAMHRNEAIKYVEDLESEGRIEKRSRGGKVFYAAAQGGGASAGEA